MPHASCIPCDARLALLSLPDVLCLLLSSPPLPPPLPPLPSPSSPSPLPSPQLAAPTSARTARGGPWTVHRDGRLARGLLLFARDAEGHARRRAATLRGGLSSASRAVVNATIPTWATELLCLLHADGIGRLSSRRHSRRQAGRDSPYRLSASPRPHHQLTAPRRALAFEAIAGESSSFVIVPRDRSATPGPRAFRSLHSGLARRGASGEASPSATATSFSSGGLKWQPAVVTDLQNGTYGAEYVVKRAGAYLIEVKLGGVHVMGSPFQVSVLAGKTSARASTAQGAGLRTSVAGTPSSFEVIARDDFGNLRSVCGDDFEVTLSGPETLKGGSHVHGIVSENGNGTYVVEYAVTSAGLYYIAVTLSGRHISGSPFSMQTMPAAARSSHSLAFGSGLSRAVAGRLNEFSILAKDTYGNAEHASAGGNFSVVLTYSSRQDGVGSSSSPSKQVGAAATLAPIKARIVDSLTGVYTASYVPKRAGTYSVDVSYNQLPIFGSPYTTVVVPGRAHAASSVVGCTEIAAEGAGDAAASSTTTECAALVGFAGEVNSFTIVSRDSEGNDCATGGEKVEALLLLPPRSSDESPHEQAALGDARGGRPRRRLGPRRRPLQRVLPRAAGGQLPALHHHRRRAHRGLAICDQGKAGHHVRRELKG